MNITVELSESRLYAIEHDQVRLRQGLQHQWAFDTFGGESANDMHTRGKRSLEESIELGQTLGVTREEAHFLVDYVFNRPIGETHQELGGLLLTLRMLAEAGGLNSFACEMVEWERVQSKSAEHFRERQQKKIEAGL